MPTRKKPAAEEAEKKPAAAPKKPAVRAKKATTAVAKTPAVRRKKAEAPAPAAPAEEAPRKGGTQNLVIVESPAKAKTIEKYLGPGFKVLASYGHVRDLPPKGKVKGEEVVGVRISEGWKPRYVVVDRGDTGGSRKRRTAADILAELKKEADRSNIIYLATDPDREGNRSPGIFPKRSA